MVGRKKVRHAAPSAPDSPVDDVDAGNSPVVSDDDGGADEAIKPGFFAADDVEFLSDSDYEGGDGDEEAEAEAEPTGAPSHRPIRIAAPTRETVRAADGTDGPDPGLESDSSSDGDANPVGDIPMRWYDGYDHIGYGRDGEQIVRANKPSALDLAADPHAWRRIYDEKNDEQLILSHDELRSIARMRAGRYPAAAAEPENDEVIAWSGAPEMHPLNSAPEPKRRFLPSRHEARTVIKMVRAMRAGTLKRPSEAARVRAALEESRYNYDIWEANEPKDVADMSKGERARELMRVPAPKVPLPKHDESYNPPPEYLPSAEEAKAWNDTDLEDRAVNYLPQQYDALRHVPLYSNFIKERFERCLDLYLAVRVRRDPERINPEDLIPQLPSPKDLRPFPSGRSASFGPLPARARSISVHPRSGQWLLAGSDDGCVRMFEVASGRLRHKWNFGNRVPKVDGQVPPIVCVAWCPLESSQVFAAAIGTSVFVVSAAEALGVSVTESNCAMDAAYAEDAPRPNVPEGLSWTKIVNGVETADARADEENEVVEVGDTVPAPAPAVDTATIDDGVDVDKDGKMVRVDHPRQLRVVTWHHKGDYFATVGKDSTGGTVAIHRLSQHASQMPFKKKTAGVQSVRFHPTRPFFFVATMHNVRIFNLTAQEAVKTLKPGVRWISSIEIHPSGDHVIVGSYDKKLCWFDLDLSMRPYKTIRNHDHAVRSAKFHPRLPLFADSADDGSVHVFHGTVYDDLNKNALIVPLKKLERYHTVTNNLGVLDIAWHPRLPWIFSSGADCSLHLFSDCS
jgi:ribosome biogenesis protein ERB1